MKWGVHRLTSMPENRFREYRAMNNWTHIPRRLLSVAQSPAQTNGRGVATSAVTVAVALTGFGLTALTACGGDRSARREQVVSQRDSAAVIITESAAPLHAEGSKPFVELSATPQLSIGVESGNESYQLHRVSAALRLADGRVVVANSGTHELRVYDTTGAYVTSVGRRGEGPGEFGEYTSPQLYAYGNRVVANDNGAFRVHIYDANMTLLHTQRLELSGATPRPFVKGVFPDGSMLVMAFKGGGVLNGPPGSVITSAIQYHHFDSAGVAAAEVGDFPGARRFVNQADDVIHYPYIPFTTDPFGDVSGNNFVVLRGDRPELEYRDMNGQITKLVRWNRERLRAADLWPAYKAVSIAELASANDRERKLYGAFFEKNIPLPEFAAMYRAMLIDDEHRVWMEHFRMPGDTTAPRWDVIDSTGTWLGVVRTPARFTVYQIGRTFLLGRARDDLGVERVQLYTLRP